MQTLQDVCVLFRDKILSFEMFEMCPINLWQMWRLFAAENTDICVNLWTTFSKFGLLHLLQWNLICLLGGPLEDQVTLQVCVGGCL